MPLDEFSMQTPDDEPNQSPIPPTPPAPLRTPAQPVVLAGLDIPFWSLVWFLMKFTVAWIPALLFLWLIALMVGGTLTALFAALVAAINGT